MRYDISAISAYVAGADNPIKIIHEPSIGTTAYIVRCEDTENGTWCYVATQDDYSDYEPVWQQDAADMGLPA